jgi:septum formation protein
MLKTMPPLILASQSQRRQEILSFFSLPFTIKPSNFDEDSLHFKGDPAAYVELLATKKAESIAANHPNSLVLGSDTLVFKNNSPLGKPKDIDEAKAMLGSLSDGWHEVLSGVALSYKGKTHHCSFLSRVCFHKLSSLDIDHYLSQIEYLDKAGSYAIQGSGGVIVKEIQGCFYNVMGLPLEGLRECFSTFGINLWEYLSAPQA